MGAWLAFELVRSLRQHNVQMPRLLFVAAARAPHLPLNEPPIHVLTDEELVEAVDRRYGGIPARVRNSPELLQLLLPSLRADLQMVETYDFREEPPLDVEIVAMGGTADPAVSAAQLEGWRQHTTKGCSVRLVPGGHFFLFDGGDAGATMSRQTVACGASAAIEMIVNRLVQCVPQASPSRSLTQDEGPGEGK
jgi:surfactin synthase thioesterase subunit